jgi:DNA-binding response OmpR family regulator
VEETSVTTITSRATAERIRFTTRILEGMDVLVVDDRRELRELFALLLASDGASVTTAGTGHEAVALASLRRFHAVLCDLGLPDVPGDRVVRELVADVAARPVVAVITGHDEPHLTRAREAGADAIFRKPVEWPRVRAFLRRVRDTEIGSGAGA